MRPSGAEVSEHTPLAKAGCRVAESYSPLREGARIRRRHHLASEHFRPGAFVARRLRAHTPEAGAPSPRAGPLRGTPRARSQFMQSTAIKLSLLPPLAARPSCCVGRRQQDPCPSPIAMSTAQVRRANLTAPGLRPREGCCSTRPASGLPETHPSLASRPLGSASSIRCVVGPRDVAILG